MIIIPETDDEYTYRGQNELQETPDDKKTPLLLHAVSEQELASLQESEQKLDAV